MKKLTANFNGAKALVADDYPINQELTKEMLEIMGCMVDVSDDGIETLKKYNKNHYDIIMLDVQMPEMDGYEVTRRIREIESQIGKHTIIIAITANALPGDEEKCIKSGMDDYIAKPIKGETLESKLLKYLKK